MIDLKELFAVQKEVDKKIRDTQGIADDVNTTDLKIIAFKVEFGEFLNENKFFKYWKVKREPEIIFLKEEFADCVAFMLALALERKWDKFIHALDVLDAESKTMAARSIDIFHNPLDSAGKWLLCMSDLLQLAEEMGISEEDINNEYRYKSKVNLSRQEEGY